MRKLSKVLNNGQIVLTGDMAYGIGAVALQTDASFIKNAGTITIHSYQIANPMLYGMYAGTMLNASKIENTATGNITLTSTGSGQSWLLGIMALNMNDASTIQNDGKISIEGIGVGSTGFATMAGITAFMYTGTPIVVNNGDITIKSLDLAGGGNGAIGIQAVLADGVTQASITNNGNITMTGYGFLGGIFVENTADNATITNGDNSKIYVNSESTQPSSIVGIYSHNAAINNSGIIEATLGGTLNTTTGKIENGLLDNTAYSIMTNSVSANVTNSGHLNGNLMLYGDLTNSGTIKLPYNANTNTTPATIGGAFTNSGTLDIGLLTDGTINNTIHSQLAVSGLATFESSSKINVDVLKSSTNETLLIGETLHGVVQVANGSTLTAPGEMTVTDNSSKLNFQYVLNGNEIDLLVLKGQSYAQRAAEGGANTTTQSAATAAEAKGIDFAGLADNNSVGFAKAVASTTPTTTLAANTASTQIMNSLQGIAEMRQNNVMSGMNSGDFTTTDKNLWTKVYGSKGKQDNKDGMNGFDINAYGIGIGADAEIGSNKRLGAAFFYTHAKVDVNNMNQNNNLDVYTALVYGSALVTENTNFLYQAGYTWQKNSSERVDFFNDRYTADYISKVASLDIKLMQTYKQIENVLTVRPLIEGTYRQFTNPTYTENGTGTAGALSVDKFTATQLIASVGAIADYKVAKNSKVVTNVKLGYDFHHDQQSVTSSYEGGYSFETKGIDNGGVQYDVGIGYEAANILGGELNFMYDYQGQGSSFNNHVLSAKYVYKF